MILNNLKKVEFKKKSKFTFARKIRYILTSSHETSFDPRIRFRRPKTVRIDTPHGQCPVTSNSDLFRVISGHICDKEHSHRTRT